MTTPLATALYLHALGATPIVLPFASKRPALDGWQKTPRPSAASLPVLFGRVQCNVGCLLGAPSGGLVDIDLDTPEAIELAPRFLPPTRTFGRASKPVSHYLYRCHPHPASTVQYKDGVVMLVEQRSTGLQTVMPGSVNGGELVEWVDPAVEIATVDPTTLRRLVSHLAAAVLLARYCGPSAAPGIAGALRAGDWPVRETELLVESVLLGEDGAAEAAARPAEAWAGVDRRIAEKAASWLDVAPPPRPPTPRVVCGNVDVMKRARAYIATMPDSIEGQGGDAATFKVAFTLVKGFALSAGDAMTILAEYNATRCFPPWSQQGLERKIASAEKTRTEAGFRLRAGRAA